MPVEQCKYLTNCWGRKPRLGLITGTQRMYDWWPGGRKNLTRFSLRQSTICGCCAVLATHFTGSTARGQALERTWMWKKDIYEGKLAGRKEGCVSRHLSCGRAIKTKQTAATRFHVSPFNWPKDRGDIIRQMAKNAWEPGYSRLLSFSVSQLASLQIFPPKTKAGDIIIDLI